MSVISARRPLRVSLAVGAVSLGLLAVAGCQRPTPNAHFTLGSDTSSPEAEHDCYGDGELLGQQRAQACLGEPPQDAPSFAFHSGDTFRVGVDPEVAESGWLLFVNGELYAPEPFTTTYRSFPSAELQAVAQRNAGPGDLALREELRVNVVEIGEDYDIEGLFQSTTLEEFQQRLYASVEGVWHARLEPEQA